MVFFSFVTVSTQVAQYFLDGGTLPAADLTAIVEAAHALWAEEPAMVEISVPPGAFVTILGDTHGQFDDVFTVLEVPPLLPRSAGGECGRHNPEVEFYSRTEHDTPLVKLRSTLAPGGR